MTPVEDAQLQQNGAILIQEAEFAVQSSIAVREEYKSKLQALLQVVALDPSRDVSQPIATKNSKMKMTSTSSKKSSRTTSKDPPRVPQGKEMQVLGDWLLLVRAASVNVVEKIQTWRRVVHQGRPQPFHYNHYHQEQSGGNYLLTMCEDLDFLDQSVDLVEWLGFRLTRNPFVVHGALDDVISEILKKAVHSARSLKYWSSSSWARQKKHLDKRRTKRNMRSEPESDYLCDQNHAFNSTTKGNTSIQTRQWRAHRHPPPPQVLVKPLASILPEDDVVDGNRIGAAQRVLLEEEAFHGRLMGFRAVRQYLVDVSSGLSGSGTDDIDESEAEKTYASVYDEIADLTTQIKCTLWTQKTRELDLTKDHRVWRCRDSYYKESSRLSSVLSDELSKRLQVLADDNTRLKGLMEKQYNHLKKLKSEKDRQRVERNNVQRREEELRRAEIRQRTVARTTKLKSAKKSKQKPISDVETAISMNLEESNHAFEEVQEIVKLVKQQHGLIHSSHADELEQNRLAAILQRDLARKAHARAIEDAAKELDRRRGESVHMRHEDELSSALERLASKKQRLRDLKMKLERISNIPVFTCVQRLSGKKLRVAIYEQRARGYILNGVRVVAYDPSSSSLFPLVMTTREYRSLGYGRSPEGFSAFCKWLCLLYEKRKRHFRLIWSGPPCPPPLRVREYDSVLCIHKEGLKLRTGVSANRSSGYFLVAVFVRPNAPAKLHFVVSDLRSGQNSISVEKVVHASNLVHPSALQVQNGPCNDDSYVVWRHHSDTPATSALDNFHQERGLVPLNGHRYSKTRVYSGETRVLDRSVLIHVYDVSPTEYTLEVQRPAASSPTKNNTSYSTKLLQASSHEFPTKRITLLKHEVNPYGVRLPSSAFSDLIASLDFTSLVGSDGTSLSSAVTPKWFDKLTKYVRVLKMARFGLKVGCKLFLATLSIVQQKTEFRSYLLLELSSLSDRQRSRKKQSIRISLSDYLRCNNASHCILKVGNGDEREDCEVCDSQTSPSLRHKVDNEEKVTLDELHSACPSCSTIQDARLLSVRNLVTLGHESLKTAQMDYHGHCRLCGALAGPILVVFNCFTTAAAAGFIQTLGYQFSCFEMASILEVDGGDREVSGITEIRQAIEVERIVVLFNADCGATAAAASEFIHELHSLLYPDHQRECQQSFHAVFVVDNRSLGVYQWQQIGLSIGSRDQEVLEALDALASATSQVGDQEPIRENDANGETSTIIEDALNFEAYLVSEALLVEATRVVLQPELPWCKPGETVGASSWGTACEFLGDPHALSQKLQLVRPPLLPQAAQAILDAYFAHPKWPHKYEDVRPIFHGLLCFMLRISHVRHVLQGRGGILQDSLSGSRETGFLESEGGDRNCMSVISLE